MQLDRFTPLAPTRIPAPFDHDEWLFELKHDGFRAVAHFEHGSVRLASRKGITYKRFDPLCRALADDQRVRHAVLDCELVVLDDEGRSDFHALLRSRGEPSLYVFDVLELGGRDLRERPLVERKRILRDLIPPRHTHMLVADHIAGRGVELYREVCARNLEGIVGKWAHGPYRVLDGRAPWVKVLNRGYSHKESRHDLFLRRGGRG